MGKIISLCVGTVVCKDFEKFKSSRVLECELCALEFKDFANFKVPRVWDVVSALWNIETLNFFKVPLCMGV